MKEIDVPGVGVVEFPDNMSDEQIAAAIRKNAPKSKWSELPGNIIPSAGRFFGGLANAVLHPIDTATGVADAAAGGLRNITPEGARRFIDKADSPETTARLGRTAGAVGDFYRKRYGGMDEARESLITDPVGVLADASTVLGVGGMVTPGKLGAALNTASTYTNPLALAGKAITSKPVSWAGKSLLGLTTQQGPENIAQAAKTGYVGDQSFLANLTGKESRTTVLDQAKQALQNMRAGKSAAYKEGIGKTAAETAKLDFAPIDAALSEVVASMKFGKEWKIGADEARKVAELEKVVQRWRMNPQMHTTMGLDALKQRLDALFPDSPRQVQAQRAITSVRNAVKDAIVKQSPDYAKTMSAYEDAVSLEKEIERALSLGKSAAEDTALRKLQSLARNNANTNYGHRLDLARALETHGGQNLLPALAGQSMNSWQSRGLVGQGAQIGALAGATVNPMSLLALPLTSPKAVGAALYGGGRVAGKTAETLRRLGITPDDAAIASLLSARAGLLESALEK